MLRPGHRQSARPGQFGDPGQGYAILCNNLRNFATPGAPLLARQGPGLISCTMHNSGHSKLHTTPPLPRIWPLRQLWGYGLFNTTHSQSKPCLYNLEMCERETLPMWCNSPFEVSACRCLICHSQREDNKKKFVVTLLS